jgi:hypothetical protein
MKLRDLLLLAALTGCATDPLTDLPEATGIEADGVAASDGCDHAGITLALDVLGSATSADVLAIAQQQQASTLATLWTAPETQRQLAVLAADAATRDAVLVVTRFQALPQETSIQAEVVVAEVSLGAEPNEIGTLTLRRRAGATATEVRYVATTRPTPGCGTSGVNFVLDVLASPISADVLDRNQTDQSAALTALWTSNAAVDLLGQLASAAERRGAVVMATRLQAFSRRGPIGNQVRAEVEIGEWDPSSEQPSVIGTVLLRRDGVGTPSVQFVPAPISVRR